jgi:ribosomal protein L37AE/L43A
MATRLVTMAAPNSSPSQVRTHGLLWRLLILLACAGAAGFASALLYLASPGLMPVTFSLLSAAAIGLVAGLSTRWLLRERSELLRISAAFASVALSITFLGWLSSGILFRSYRPASPDWTALILLGLGWLTSWLALRAWRTSQAPPRQTAPVAPQTTQGEPRRTRRAQSSVPATDTRKPRPRLPAFRPRRMHLPRFLRRRTHQINLVGKTEHRCPYCLEVIHRRDPRGVVVCPECKTPHHADCWGVTGMCQIPHQHR